MGSLTEATDTVACMTSQVEAIDGPNQMLSGGYAAVTGYTYATPACTGTSLCKNQDLDKLQAALEETPVSVCVNAGAWNSYTGGVMTSAPTPYWIVRNSWSDTWGEEGYIYLEMAENTCGLADDATIPTVAYDGDSAKVTANFEHHYSRAAKSSTNVV